MANLFPCGGGNPNLKFDSSSGYIQAKDTDGNWVNIYSSSTLPIPATTYIVKDGILQNGYKYALHAYSLTSTYNGSSPSIYQDSNCIRVQCTGDGTWNGCSHNVTFSPILSTNFAKGKTLHMRYSHSGYTSATGGFLLGIANGTTVGIGMSQYSLMGSSSAIKELTMVLTNGGYVAIDGTIHFTGTSTLRIYDLWLSN